MKITAQQEALVKEFAPQIGKPSPLWYTVAGIFLACFLAGIYALYYQIAEGHIVTGMRDNVVWGLYIVNFIFFMGLSYAGALISGVLHLYRSNWRHPIVRMSELITVISLVIGPFFILFCIGRLDRLFFLFGYPRIQSPIVWDVVAISTDLVGCFIYLYLSFIHDFAILRDTKVIQLSPWRKKLYSILALGYQDTPSQRKHIQWARDIMSAMIIAIAIIVYSVLAWIFGVTLQPGWHSTIFGPYFVIAAVYSGAGLLIIIMAIFRKVYHLQQHITQKHFVLVGMILMVISAFYGYFTFSDYLTKWYGSVKMDKLLIDKLFTNYYWLFIFSNYFCVLFPMIIMGFKRFRKISLITLSAVVAVVGLWFNRYLIVVPTLETPYLPIQETRLDWLHYSPTWVEFSLTLAGFATMALLFMLAAKFVPIVSISELTEKEHESVIQSEFKD
jgi:Ni/Fe-hydrogenase subunit HybB-like protein